MADEHDYTQMWSGVFTPPQIGDDDRGLHLLDEADYYEAPANQRFGRNGTREGFDSGGSSQAAFYTQGSRVLGHPGPRGAVTSSRAGRAAIDSIDWDNRPPHYAADTPNKYAHLYIDPTAQGPALAFRHPAYPHFRQVDRFGVSGAGSTSAGGGGAGGGGAENTGAGGGGAQCSCGQTAVSVETMKAILFVIVVVLVAMCFAQQAVANAEKRIAREFRRVLLETVFVETSRTASK